MVGRAPATLDDRAAELPPQAARATAGDVSFDDGDAMQAKKFRSVGLAAIGIAWLGASVLQSVRLVLSCLATRRLLRGAILCDDTALLAASAAAAQRIGLRKPPALLVSRDVQTPTIFALGPPRLLVPADYSARAADRKNIDWTAAFAHELAHAARHDGWARLWVEFIQIALPLQPLVWLARRTFHTACEEACDDWAVATGSDPVDLAETLTAWIKAPKPVGALVVIGMSSTKSRTLRLLALRDKPIARLNRAWRWLGVLTALLLIAGLAIAQSPPEKPAKAAEPPKSTGDAKGGGNPSKKEAKSSSEQPSGKGDRTSPPPYVIEPPDVLTITDAVLVLKETTRVAPLDNVGIDVDGTSSDNPIRGVFRVGGSGDVVLGTSYGSVKIGGLTRLEAQEAVSKKLAEILKEPHVALTMDETRRKSGIFGQFLVGPDGRINLGIHGAVHVAGLTVADACAEVEKKLSDSFLNPTVAIDVSYHSSKGFYVVSGSQIARYPITGNETVMDAVSQALPNEAESIESISVSRASSTGKVQPLEVHWKDVLQGDDATNYQIFPGDRVLVRFVHPKDNPVGPQSLEYYQRKSQDKAPSTGDHNAHGDSGSAEKPSK